MAVGALLAAFAAPPAQAAKLFESFVGGTSGAPALGGTFAVSPRDVAVNEASIDDGNPAASGDFYVVDDGNHRIQRFNADGSFDLAWGADVVQSGMPGDLSGSLPMEPNPFEICAAAADCKAGVPTGGNGFASGNGSLDNPQAIAVDQDTGNVYVSNRDNRRVDIYEADGTPLRAFGFDVVAAGPGNTGAGYEICVPAAGDVCKVGVGANNPSAASPGANPGQFSAGATLNGFRIDVSKPDGNAATGKVYLANTGSQRVEVFDLDGTSPTNFGTTADFAANQPLGVAVGDDDVVFATNSASSNAILRYDTDASAFLSPVDLASIGGSGGARNGVEIDRTTGNLVVASATSSPAIAVISEVAVDGSDHWLVAQDPILVEGAVAVPFGLGLDGSSSRVYVATNTGGQRVALFRDEQGPAVSVDAVNPAAVHGGSVPLSGTIDAGGSAAGAQFEVRGPGDPTWVPGEFLSIAPGGGVADAQSTLSGVRGGGNYQVRLAASSEGARSYSRPVSFAAPVDAPRVSRLSATPGADFAHVGATVEPNGADTDYRIELGLESCATGGCESVAEGSIPANGGPKWVTAAPDDLKAGAVYHYRVVAESAEGVTEGEEGTVELPTRGEACANDEVRRSQRSMHLEDCRAYEMVSPVRKYNGGVVFGHRGSGDGNAVGYLMNTPTSEDDGGFPSESFVSRRTATGWTAASTAQPMRAEERGTGGITSIAVDFSEDFTWADVKTNDPVDPADRHPRANAGGITDGFDIYRFNPWTREPSTWLTRPDPALAATIPAGPSVQAIRGRSLDRRHLVFNSEYRPVPGDWPLLYESVEGALRPVGVLPNGTPAPTADLPTVGRLVLSAEGSQAVSDDGRRIYWDTSTAQIYVRQDGADTFAVSEIRRAGGGARVVPAVFLGAARDGSWALIASSYQLTDDAPSGGIFRYDIDENDLTFVQGIDTVPRNTSTVVAADSSNYGPILSEDDRDRLYFLSASALVSGASGPGLYLWDGDLTEVAPASPTGPVVGDLRLRVSGDGRYAVFSSTRSLDPRHPEGTTAIYRFDAEAEELECVSCPAPSGTSGNSEFRPSRGRFNQFADTTFALPRNVSDDGRVFFHTTAELLPADTNRNYDVYEFGDRGLALVSSGQDPIGAEFIDNSDDGSSVFLMTPETLSGHDVDRGSVDVYVARTNGGFPEPDPERPPCAGDSCQGDPTPSPRAPQVGTPFFGGAGDVVSKRAPSVKVSGRRTVSGVRAKLGVRVPTRGEIVVSGRFVRTQKRAAGRAATYSVALALTPSGRRALRERGRLRVKARIRFRATDGGTGSRAVAVTFRRPAVKKGGR